MGAKVSSQQNLAIKSAECSNVWRLVSPWRPPSQNATMPVVLHHI